MKKIGVCGVHGYGSKFSGGQPVKVRMIIEELEEHFGGENVIVVNTHNWKKKPFKLMYECIKMFYNCDKILMLPAHNGVRVFTPFFLVLNKFFNRDINYIVIGGWIADMLKKNEVLKWRISKFKGVYVETQSMKKSLEYLGLKNVKIMNNFKNLKPLQKEELNKSYSEPFKVCMFSRIVLEKGVEDAITSIIKINETSGREIYHLDLYGFLDEKYKLRFHKIIEEAPSYIKYCGVAAPENSVNILRKYFIQLFPTRYLTEGIPGSIIDSYFAGVPVVSSKWNSFNDVIDEGKTGVGFEILNNNDLTSKLLDISKNPQNIIEMKPNCINKSIEFTPDYVMENFIKDLECN